jgi:hypothetical protein
VLSTARLRSLVSFALGTRKSLGLTVVLIVCGPLVLVACGPAPTITSANHATFTVGTSGSFTVTASGTPTPNLTESGALPTGVTFTPEAGTATIGGTPAHGTGGSYALKLTASNGNSPNATQTFTVAVDQPPTITSAASTSFPVRGAGSFHATATGYPTPTFALTSGSLPAGVTFSASGLLSGTVTSTGTYTFGIRAQNGIGSPSTQTFSLIIGQAPAFTSSATVDSWVTVPLSYNVTTSGYPAPTLTASGALPSGLKLTITAGTAVLSGTPTISELGTTYLTLTATNSQGTAKQTLVLTIHGTNPSAIVFPLNSTRTPPLSATPVQQSTLAPPGAIVDSVQNASDDQAGVHIQITLECPNGNTVTIAADSTSGACDGQQFYRTWTVTAWVTSGSPWLASTIAVYVHWHL